MTIIVHQYLGKLPESRIELYKEIFEVYLGERWRWKEAPNGAFSAREKQKILQTLAYKMMEGEIREIESANAEELIKTYFENIPMTPERFLQSVRDNGILGPFPGPYYGFAHRSFQEYLAAMYVKDIRQPELLVNHINLENLDWWRETIVLYCAQADPTPIITVCLKEDSLSEDSLDLALALYLEPEVQKNVDHQANVKPEVLEIRSRFDQAVSLATEDKDIKLRHKIANALLTRRKQNLTPDDETSEEEPMKDRSFIKCAEYQLFLDEPENHSRQPDHWQDDRFPTGQGLEPVLGVRPSDAVAFCKWLTTQEAGACYYRLPTSEETQDISVGETGRGYWIDDGNDGFGWANGEPLSSSILSQDRLHAFWAQDNVKPEVRNPADYTSFVDKLEDVRKRHHDLVERLTSIRERISKHESDLQGNYDRTRKPKEGLENQITAVRAKRAESEIILKEIQNLRTQRAEATENRARSKQRLDDVHAEIDGLNEELLTLEKRARKLPQIQPASNRSIGLSNYRPTGLRSERKLPQIQPASNRSIGLGSRSREQIVVINRKIAELEGQKKRKKSLKEQLDEKLKNDAERESKLKAQLEGADEKEKSARQQLESANIQESRLTKPLEDARKDLEEAEQQLSCV
jgi:hypothetical protein